MHGNVHSLNMAKSIGRRGRLAVSADGYLRAPTRRYPLAATFEWQNTSYTGQFPAACPFALWTRKPSDASVRI
jgi:hypothetical protein